MPLTHIAKDIKDIKRFEHILGMLMKHGFGMMIDNIRLKRHVPVQARIQKHKIREDITHAARMRMVFEELGGTFIKLGQLLSLRPDLIPKEYCDEFRKMQDEVPGFEGSVAREIAKQELAKAGKQFSYFNTKPIAAASIGQVHEAVLQNGQKVAVKVQRPGIRKLIETDIDIMLYFAKLIEKHYGTQLFNPTEIVQEFRRYTENELDYVAEGRNIDKFYKNFEHDKKVVIPKVYWEYTTDKVLTMEYLKGLKISEVKRIEKREKERKKITKEVAEIVFKQIFIHGFFHADPHPGNILIMEGGKIGLLDFGIVGYIDDDLREKFSALFISLMGRELDGIADSMLELGMVEANVDVDALKEDIHSSFSRYYETPLKEIKVGHLFHLMMDIIRKYKIKLPPTFVLLFKSLLTVEGFAVELDPEFNLIETSKPFVKQLERRSMQPRYLLEKGKKSLLKFKRLFTKLPDSVNTLLYRIKDVDDGVKNIDTDIKAMTYEVDKSSNRIALGLLITGFVIASALMINIGEPVLYGIPPLSLIGFAVALFMILLLVMSIINEKRLR